MNIIFTLFSKVKRISRKKRKDKLCPLSFAILGIQYSTKTLSFLIFRLSPIQYSVTTTQSTVSTIKFTVSTVLYIVHSVYCTKYSFNCTVHSVYYQVYSFHFTQVLNWSRAIESPGIIEQVFIHHCPDVWCTQYTVHSSNPVHGPGVIANNNDLNTKRINLQKVCKPVSKIRHGDFRPPDLVTLTLFPPPPWILKRGELESSGQRLISSFGKTKGMAFIFFKKKI